MGEQTGAFLGWQAGVMLYWLVNRIMAEQWRGVLTGG